MSEIPTNDRPQVRRKAYSYLRFSTPEQVKGDSFRRQASMALAYAEKNDLDLDHELTFHDVGVSAYRGQNADAGRLACFVEAVRSGQVPQGSLLLVEQLDRISRLTPRKALRVLEDIVETGVSVVTMNDGREYTSTSLDNDHMDLMWSLMIFMRANDESATKSSRLRAAWEGKRADVEKGKRLTSKAPAWLKLSEDRTIFAIIPERADLVQRIFAMTLEGVGQHRIAATFNREGIAPWGRGSFWQRSYIAKVLANPAVLGTFSPHVMEFDGTRKSRRALDPIDHYFPAVISEETYKEAQALRQALSAPQRGRHANAPITNVLAGLAACPKCGSTMTRVAKGKRSRPAYVCTRAKAKTQGHAGCVYKSVRCELIEDAILRSLPSRLRDLEGVGGKDEELVDAVRAADDRLDRLHDVIDRLIDDLSYVGRSPALAQRLRDAEAELEEAKEAARNLKDRQEIATGLTVGARVNRALEALEPADGEPDPARINLALRSIFKRAVIDWEGHLIHLEWTHGGTCLVPYNSFTEWSGPGWVWSQEEEVHAE
ncbi:recombinase family protein [Novosphingobium sp. G106]|uniref:recombinase family protein n=1 Tax=Novosphingobium sp. G106 TaxID=2849500 RepID=UPI001C2CF535|nr:recombinase family protein [Novosphingobium sp. G106]MBV1690871.1 recombinase family protein [Novosphingobium sp. G106]